MTKQKRAILLSVFLTLVFVTVFLAAFIKDGALTVTEKHKLEVNLTAEETEKIVIASADRQDFTLLFSSDSLQADQNLAKDLETVIRNLYNVRVRPVSDTNQAETEHEILIGNTNRDESAELLSELVATLPSGSKDYAWAFAYMNGKLVFVANDAVAYQFGSTQFVEYLTENDFTVPSELCVFGYKTRAEYEEYLREQEAIKREEYILSLIEKNNTFADSQFNTDKFTGSFYKPMIAEDGSGYYTETSSGEPWFYPTEDQHPRYLITADKIEIIKAMLEEGKNEDSEYYNLARNFWNLANAEESSHHWGEFPVGKLNGNEYRWDGNILAIIEAKALAYLVTGDEVYAREAVICIKNAVLTLNYTTDLHMDVYHGPSHVMVILAAVYDWCYDVMSETDKWQLIWGTAQILGPQMEAGYQYPPSGFNGVNGHGTGPQLLRDWMSVSTVFYDEAPDWWEFVGGRYFNEFLPVANAQFQNGWVSQGTACYAPIKVYVQAWAAYLTKTSMGESFITEDIQKTMYYFMSHITPRDIGNSYEQYYFQTGDGSRTPDGTKVTWAEFMVIAALCNDPVLYAQAKDLTNNFLYYNNDTIYTLGPAFQLCFASAVDYNGEGARDGVEAIQYFGYPAAQMTARETWGDPDSAAVLMRLMNLTMANHEGQDHGTFQIYYKGLLASTSGKYNKYGSAAHLYYQQATISSNGLLIFNPVNADAVPNGDGVSITNAARYYYSGSQRKANIGTENVDAWLNSESAMAETTGASWGYNDDGSSKYAYLGGDLTLAYEQNTVDYVGRKMFTLFTGDENFPVLFFTFDQILSDSKDFTKHWLLHTIKEPTVDQDNLTATVINGEGKMYLKSLYGADSIVKIGGTGRAWWINGYFTDPSNKGSWDAKTQSFTDETNKGSWVEGKNAIDDYANNDDADNIWGRIELRTESEKFSRFFTVMAVTDTVNETPFAIEKFVNDTETVFGAKYDKSIIAFVSDEENPSEKKYKEFSFTTSGKGLYEYYIAGLEAGTWNVKVDGVSVAYSYADEDGELLTFIAPAGEISVTPSSNVIGANGGKINYVTGGAVLPSDTPYVYNNELDFPLPTEATRGEDKFVGWYTSPNFESETAITAIPKGTTGTFTVYAKWISNFVNEDYTTTKINHQATSKTHNGIEYFGSGKTGSSFITKTDSDGVNYLEWLEGSQDPFITMKSSTKNFSGIGTDDKCIAFTVKLSLNGDNPSMATNMRIIAKKDVNGAAINSSPVYIFSTDTDGKVLSHNGNHITTLSADKVTNVRVVVDFKNGEIRYYDDEFGVMFADSFKAPAATLAQNTEEFLKCLTEYLFYFYGGTPNNITDAALRIYGIRIQEGDEFAGLAKPQTEGIKYNGNGAKIPYEYPKNFNEDGSITILPDGKELSLNGYVFDGWYTTPTFDEGTSTSYVPANYEGLYEIWAKWNKVFVNEDYSSVNIDRTEQKGTYNGIEYFGQGKKGSSFKTVEENGERYLVFTPGEADPTILISNTASNISTMSGDFISYTLTFSKNGAATIPTFEFRLIGKHTAAGETGKGDSNIYLGKINENGEFTLGTGTTVVSAIGDKPVTIRIVLNFANGTIDAYDEWGNVLASTSMPDIPSHSGASNYQEWKQCFRSYLLYTRRTGGSAEKIAESIRIYGIRIEEGNAFALRGDEEAPKQNSIIYETNNGTLPADAPTEYDVSLGTLLPVNVTREGYIFAGWYTDAKFNERIDYIPFGTQNPVKVYAKWLYVPMDEDWDDREFVHPESSISNQHGFIYNTGSGSEKKPGTGFETVKDEDGNTYIRTFSPSYTVFLVANNGGKYQFPEFNETAVTFEFDYGRDGDLPLASNGVRFQTPSNAYGRYQFLTINGATGEARLMGGSGVSSKVIATIGSEMVSFRITVDFALATVTAYGENGEILDRLDLGAPPTSAAGKEQPATWAEWQKLATGYYVYNQLDKPSDFTAEDGALFGARFDNFKVIDGMPYIKFDTKLPTSNSIKYETNGGTLSDGAVTEYDPAAETSLPTAVKDGYVFAGWYSSESLDEGTRVEKIPVGTEGMVTLYAKWGYVFADENFDKNTAWSATNNTWYNKLNFILQKSGTSAKAMTDEQGNTYVAVTVTNSDGILAVTNASYNLTHMSATKLSIKLDLIAPEDGKLSNLNIKIASSGGSYGQLSLAGVNGATGQVKLDGGTKVLAELTPGARVTLRLLVDFAEGKVYAYGEDGNVIDSFTPIVPGGNQGTPATLAEWQKVSANYLFYGYMTNPDAATDGSSSSIGFDNVKITEGFAF